GHAVLGFDVDAAKGSAIGAFGGAVAASLPDLVRQCEMIFVAVFDTDQVEDVTENAILPAAGENAGKTVLCVSTCDPDRIAKLAARVAPRGLHFVEAPVSGTSAQVRRGQGVGLIGGEAGTIQKADAVLRAVFPLY